MSCDHSTTDVFTVLSCVLKLIMIYREIGFRLCVINIGVDTVNSKCDLSSCNPTKIEIFFPCSD